MCCQHLWVAVHLGLPQTRRRGSPAPELEGSQGGRPIIAWIVFGKAALSALVMLLVSSIFVVVGPIGIVFGEADRRSEFVVMTLVGAVGAVVLAVLWAKNRRG